MKFFTCLLLAPFTGADNSNSNLTKISNGLFLSGASHRSSATSATPATLPISSGASATAHHVPRREPLASLQPLCPPYTPGLPLKVPSRESDLRKNWIPVATGRPVASTPTPTRLHTSMVTPPPSLHNRQVPIPYIPADWRTRVECPAVQGLPCITMSEYLPYLQGAANKAPEEAARASSLANNGAYVPGMDVPAPSEGSLVLVVGISYLLASWLTCMIALILIEV